MIGTLHSQPRKNELSKSGRRFSREVPVSRLNWQETDRHSPQYVPFCSSASACTQRSGSTPSSLTSHLPERNRCSPMFTDFHCALSISTAVCACCGPCYSAAGRGQRRPQAAMHEVAVV